MTYTVYKIEFDSFDDDTGIEYAYATDSEVLQAMQKLIEEGDMRWTSCGKLSYNTIQVTYDPETVASEFGLWFISLDDVE